MSAALPVLKVAVVGHTNAGKTSLLRTLTRDETFGEVSASPGTTRHVEGAVLLVGDKPCVELYDTPGLEDSINLLEHLDRLRRERSTPWFDVIAAFLDSAEARSRFEQESKALRQFLHSDVALYVIDARDRVLGKHRDELEILVRCARPVVPVLNFVAAPDAEVAAWREQLSKLSMHAVAEFDTVVLNEHAEQRLFEKMLTLLDPFRPTLEALIADRKRQRAMLVRDSAELVADLLIDVAAFTVTVASGDAPVRKALASTHDAVRGREQQCVDALLELFRFRADDYEAEAVPVEDGHLGLDLFNPASLKRFGIRAGSGAAAGAAAGLAVDVMTGGLSLGAAAALGATVGALWGSFDTHGRRIAHALRGYTELRVKETTLRLLALRQLDLVHALLRRGHAAQDRIRLDAAADWSRRDWVEGDLPSVLLEARAHPEWSRLGDAGGLTAGADAGRAEARERLADGLARQLSTPLPDDGVNARAAH